MKSKRFHLKKRGKLSFNFKGMKGGDNDKEITENNSTEQVTKKSDDQTSLTKDDDRSSFRSSKRTRSRSSSKKTRSRSSSRSSKRTRSRSSSKRTRSKSSSKKTRSRSSSRSRSSKSSRSSSKKTRSRSSKSSRRSSRSSSRSRSSKRKQSNVGNIPRLPKTRIESENPITGEPFSKQYRQIKQQVDQLPANKPQKKREFLELLDQNRVLLVTGGTGSGKSTQIPKIVYQYFNYFSTVICTQPTRLTSQGIARRVAQELDVDIGSHVGYIYQGSTLIEEGQVEMGINKLLFVSDGYLKKQFLTNPNSINQYGAVIIDEAHLRSVNIDIILWLIKKALAGNVLTKFIIMSATINKDELMNYYRQFDIQHFHIEGRTFPIDLKYRSKSIYQNSSPKTLKKDMTDGIKEILMEIFKIERKNKSASQMRDILVFVHSIGLTVSLAKHFEEDLKKEGITNFVTAHVSGQSNQREKDYAINPRPGMTKIVFSTPVAETGITINGIYYVIDTGLASIPGYNLIDRYFTLDTNLISQAEANQRKGRAGRNQAGVCYRLYTEEEYNNMNPNRKTEIETSQIDNLLLDLIYFENHNPGDPIKNMVKILTEMVSRPSSKEVFVTLKYLTRLGLLERDSNNETHLTNLGLCCMGFQMPIEITMSMLSCYHYQIDDHIIGDLFAIMMINPKLYEWYTNHRKFMNSRWSQYYHNPYGDLAGLYHIYLDWMDKKLPEEMIRHLNLDYFKMISETSDELISNPAISQTGACVLVDPKYKIRSDMFINVSNAFKQVYQADPKNILNVKEIDERTWKSSLLRMDVDAKVSDAKVSNAKVSNAKVIPLSNAKVIPLSNAKVIPLSKMVNLFFGKDLNGVMSYSNLLSVF